MSRARRRPFGSIRQVGNSLTCFWLQGSKRKHWTLPLGSTMKEAEAFLLRKRLEVQTGTALDVTSSTFGEFLNDWLERRDFASPNTERIYRHQVGRLTSAAGIGTVRLQVLTINHAERAKKALAKDLAPKTVNDIINMGRAACNWAIDHDLLLKNPFGRGLSRQARVKPNKKALNAADARKVFAAMKAEGAPFGTFLGVALLTIQRAGSELCGLRWQDVDLDAGTMTINQVWLQKVRQFVPAGNFKHKRRTLPLAPEAVALLRTQHVWQERMKRWRAEQELGIQWTTDPRFQGLVFTAMDGEPLARNSFMYALRRLCQVAGVERLAPHELRHTGVSLLIAMGYNIKQIQELAGHTTVGMTLDQYGHLFPADVIAAVNALGDNLATIEASGGAS